MTLDLLGFAASLVMGVILGLVGGGGSILTVPILVYLFSLSPSIATGYSLFVVGLTALVGAAMALRRGQIDLGASLAFVFPSVLGVNIARGWIVPRLPLVIAQVGPFVLTKEVLIMLVFALLMIAASASMIRRREQARPFAAPPLIRALVMGLLGLSVGVIAGFVGAGGGFLIIPALVFMAGLSMRIAVGSSLTIIAIQSLFGFASDVARGMLINWTLLLTVAAFAAVGIVIGSVFSSKINDQKLKAAFGWFVLGVGCLILAEQVHQLI